MHAAFKKKEPELEKSYNLKHFDTIKSLIDMSDILWRTYSFVWQWTNHLLEVFWISVMRKEKKSKETK